MPNQECLNALQAFPNKEVEQNQADINEKIENFKWFYEQQGVPEGEIFLSGIVSAKKILELCNDVDFLTIQLGKDSRDVNNLLDFRIIISQCDQSADIIPPNNFGLSLSPTLIFNSTPNFRASFMDASCCRHPPGNG